MNPDHANPLEDHVEAIAEKGLSPSHSSAAATRQLIQLTALKLSQAAQNAENYKQSVVDASHSLEQLLKVPAHEFDYSQFFKTADVLLKAGKSPIPGGDKHSRSSILQNGNLELVDMPNRQSSSSSELNQQLDSQSIAQVNELRPDLVQPSDHIKAPPAEQIQSDRNVVPQYVDNGKADSPDHLSAQPQEVEVTTKPYLNAATSKIMSAQGKIFS